MADRPAVELALQQPRPPLKEIAAILAICLAAFAGLVAIDGAAQRGEEQKARKALAARAAAARNPTRAEQTRRAGDNSITDAGPITIPVGSAWSPGNSQRVGHAKVTAAVGTAVSDGPSTVLLALLAALGAALASAGGFLRFGGPRRLSRRRSA